MSSEIERLASPATAAQVLALSKQVEALNVQLQQLSEQLTADAQRLSELEQAWASWSAQLALRFGV